MAARIINGAATAALVRAEVAERVASLPFQPGLAVILVGGNPASAIYVRNKDRAASAAGIAVQTIHLPATCTEADLLAEIAYLNANAQVDGILVQLPLPPQIRTHAILESIDPAKDVDGFHPLNAGLLAEGRPALTPCTPLGIMRLFREYSIPLDSAQALVLGRSPIVGRPMAAMLLAENATPTIAHSRTPDIPAECRRADVLVVAVGRPQMVRGDWIKPGATVVDVGINRLESGRLVGDVAFSECAAVAGAITPVPGGVGPITIATLLENTVKAAVRRRG